MDTKVRFRNIHMECILFGRVVRGCFPFGNLRHAQTYRTVLNERYEQWNVGSRHRLLICILLGCVVCTAVKFPSVRVFSLTL
jgi:hypothetical protein